MSSSNCKSWDGKAEKENKALQGHSDPPLITAANVLITKTDTHRFPTLRVKREASLCHLYLLDHFSVLFLASSVAPSPLQCLLSNLLIHQPERYNLVPQLSQLSGYHGNAALLTSVLQPTSALAGVPSPILSATCVLSGGPCLALTSQLPCGVLFFGLPDPFSTLFRALLCVPGA